MKSTSKIVITGGIAAGKTTCAEIFANLGACVHEADDIAKELLDEDSIIDKCKQYFGNDILLGSKINRQKLRHNIFNNSEARIWLNQIMHPKVFHELNVRTKKATKYYHLLVIPLFFESHNDYQADKVISVLSKYQAVRASKRDQQSSAQIKQIMQVQVLDDVRIDKSDFIIYNDGQDLKQQVLTIHHQIISG